MLGSGAVGAVGAGVCRWDGGSDVVVVIASLMVVVSALKDAMSCEARREGANVVEIREGRRGANAWHAPKRQRTIDARRRLARETGATGRFRFHIMMMAARSRLVGFWIHSFLTTSCPERRYKWHDVLDTPSSFERRRRTSALQQSKARR